MSKRIDASWVVVDSVENDERNRCVDVFRRLDGSVGFEAFRRDPEDAGAWTPVGYRSGLIHLSKGAVVTAAARLVAWFTPSLPP